MKICSIEGCNSPVWSKGLCGMHSPKKRISIKRDKYATLAKRESVSKMQLFFSSLWREKPHYSEIDGTPLGNEALSIFFHHILSKKKYPEAAFDKDNIIFLALDQHSSVELDMYKYAEINRRRETLLLKYNSLRETNNK